jgi:hypothetical protein
MPSVQAEVAPPICCQRVARINGLQNPPECELLNGSRIALPRLIAAHISSGDEISFPLLNSAVTIGTEIHVSKNTLAGSSRAIYQASISYVTQPQENKRGDLYVAAQVCAASLGISSILISCQTLREYFYRIPRIQDHPDLRTFYDILRIPAAVCGAELRVAFKLRQLELQAANAPPNEHSSVERAFNILGDPELRACYDRLLKDPDAPALFPYGGFGSLVVSGERSRNGNTFFAHCIIAFLPEQHHRRFRAPLRKCDFYTDRALYRDIRRKLQMWIDPAALHAVWDSTWNRWKHLLGTQMEVNATFVKSGKYRRHRNEWQLVTWETALPSRLQVRLPADFQQQIEAARLSYHRFGQYSAALDNIRAQIENRPTEKAELERMLSSLNIPGDFDIAQISWRPDYDPFFYQQLSRRARRIYLFRNEYIFDLEKAVIIETPQLGNATYVFSKPQSMESFLAIYAGVSKDDIRHNRSNAGEKLGFLCRIIHGGNPRVWARELRARIGEISDFAAAATADHN